MMTNEELVRKAVITTDALAAAGKLNPEQADRFLDFVIQETVLKDNARIVKFRNESLDIDKIGIGTRAAMPKSEATDPGLRRGVSTSKVTLTPREIMVPVEISDNFTEINIEGESVEDHIMQMFARQLANDLEELYIRGDTLGEAVLEDDIIPGGSTTQYVKDSYLAMFDGWARLADDGNIVDSEAANIGLAIFSKLLRAMPTKFRRNKNQLRWFLAPDLWELYAEKLATRATALGDAAAGGGMHKPLGIEAVPVPLMDLNPRVVEHILLSSGTPTVALRYAPVSNVIVSKNTLGGTPETPYTVTTDYTIDAVAGTITRVGGSIGDPETVKVTYDANPQMLLTHQSNLIVGIGRDVRIEKDRDIYKGVNQYAITVKVSVELEEDEAVAKAINIGTGV